MGIFKTPITDYYHWNGQRRDKDDYFKSINIDYEYRL